ncbi:MAG: hypothetical protein AB8I08_31510 [Sandaracinaceae bacterium]
MTKTATRLLLALTLVACGASDEAESAPAEAPAPVTPQAVPVANGSVVNDPVEADAPDEAATDEAGSVEAGRAAAARAPEPQEAAPPPMQQQAPATGMPLDDPMPSGEGRGGRVEGITGGMRGPGLGAAPPSRRPAAPRSPSAFDIEE